MSDAAADLEAALRHRNAVRAALHQPPLPLPIREARLLPPRRWRWDLAWPEHKIVCEVDGGGWSGGRHSRGGGIQADCEKQCAAAIAGYRTMRVTPGHVESGDAVLWIEAALSGAALSLIEQALRA